MKVKVIHCIAKLKGGGAETQLNILLEQSNNELQNIVVSYDEMVSNQTTYYQIKRKNLLLNKWIEFYKICKKEKPDIIHIWLPAIFHVYCIPSFFINVPKLLGVRNVYQLNSIKRKLHFAFYVSFNNIVSNTHLENHEGLFKSLFKRKNYFFIPNAIKFDLEENFSPKKDSLDLEKFKFLFVGRLVKQKNIPTLLEALSFMSKDSWELTIVGKGQEYPNLKSLTKKFKIENQVIFKPFTDNIKAYYQSADALILPSFTEGMPNVVFEAAIFNTILILSDIPQHKKWFTHKKNALLFNPNSPEEIAQLINVSMNLTESEIINYHKEVRKVISGLTKKKFSDNYINLYNKIHK